MFIDEAGQSWPVWAGVRRTTEDLSAAGIYRPFPGDDEPQHEFRPLLLNMDHETADVVADAFAAHLRTYPDPTLEKLAEFAERLAAAARGEDPSTLEPGPAPEPDRSLSLDL